VLIVHIQLQLRIQLPYLAGGSKQPPEMIKLHLRGHPKEYNWARRVIKEVLLELNLNQKLKIYYKSQ
jgi:hypothetical protein